MFFFTSITSTGIPSLLRNATRPGGEEEEVSGVERQQVDDGEEESEGGNMEERVREKWEERGGDIDGKYVRVTYSTGLKAYFI